MKKGSRRDAPAPVKQSIPLKKIIFFSGMLFV